MATCGQVEPQQKVFAVSPISANGGLDDIHPMRRGGVKSFVDDLVLGRGVVISRAATSLRSVETQPLTRRFVRNQTNDISVPSLSRVGGLSLCLAAGARSPLLLASASSGANARIMGLWIAARDWLPLLVSHPARSVPSLKFGPATLTVVFRCLACLCFSSVPWGPRHAGSTPAAGIHSPCALRRVHMPSHFGKAGYFGP